MEAKNLQEFQKELLTNLYELREALISDIKSLEDVTPTVAVNADGVIIDPKDKRIDELEA